MSDVPGSLPAARRATAAQWRSRIRRTLLVAHALPATFGLVAMLVIAGQGEVRPVDVAIWAVVLVWDLFLLVFGWKRVGAGARLARWVIADAAVMAALAFVGTPLRAIVVYAAVEGALFAAVFVSWRIAVLQIGIVYGAVGAAGLARDLGSDLPSPNTGWMLPLVVSLVGVLALTFLGKALDDLEAATLAREDALRSKGLVDAEIEAQRVRAAALTEVDGIARPGLAAIERLVDDYRRRAAGEPEAEPETAWLTQVVADARSALAELDEIGIAPVAQPVVDIVHDAAARVRAAGLLDGVPLVDLDDECRGWSLPGSDAAALREFVTEAITNACSHGAPPFRLVARLDEDGVMRVAVVDAGAGFEPGAVARGMGLGALAEAAGRLRGQMSTAATPGGFEVALSFVPRYAQ